MQAIKAAFREDPRFEKLQEYIETGNYPLHVWGLDKRVAPLLMESVERRTPVRLIVTYEEKRAREIVEDYRFYDREVFYYPAKDALFYYADVHSNATVKSRLEIFKKIAEGEQVTVVTTIEGLMDKIPALSHIVENVVSLSVEQSLDLKKFSRKLTTLGYEKVTMVETPGQFSVRGGIVDIYPLTEECPYRVELWGDDIESIRSFDVESQRSIEEVKSVKIYPSCEMVLDDERIEKGIVLMNKEHKAQAKKLKEEFRTEQYARLNKMVESVKEELKEFNSTMGLDSMVEYFYDDTVSFLDYIPKEADIFVDDPERVHRQAVVYTQEFAFSMEGRLEGGYVLPTQANVLYDGKTIVGRISNRRTILISELYTKQLSWGEKDNIMISTKGLVSYNNSFETLISDIQKWNKKQYRIIILSPSGTRGKRIAKDLRDNDIMANFTEDKDRILKPGEIRISVGRMETGFEVPECKLAVISEADIFTSKELKKRKKLPKYKGDKINGFADISIGDYVVHERHGIGIYRGIAYCCSFALRLVDMVTASCLIIGVNNNVNMAMATTISTILKPLFLFFAIKSILSLNILLQYLSFYLQQI